MSELVTISLKMPSELRDRLKDRATGEGATTSALVLRAVQVMLEGDGDAKVHEPDPRVAELETALAGQKALTAKWQKAAQAVVVKPIAVANVVGRHPSGPVYEPKLSVSGTAQPIFRKSAKPAEMAG